MWGFLAGWHESQSVDPESRRPGTMEMVFWAVVGICAAIAFILVYPPVFGPLIGALFVLSVLGALGQRRGLHSNRR